MGSIKDNIQTLIIELSINGRINSIFHIIFHSLALLQTITTILPPQSTFYKIISWSDPTKSMGTQPTILFTTFLIILFVFLLILKMNWQNFKNYQETQSCLRYLINIILPYVKVVCETVIPIPLILSTLKEVQLGNTISLLGVAHLVLYIVVVFPILCSLASNASIFKGQIDSKIALITPLFLLIIFRLVFSVSSILGPSATITSAILWIIIYIFCIIRTPISCYEQQRFSRALSSIVTFTCIIFLSNTIYKTPEGFILLEIIILACFCCAIEAFSNFRINQIIKSHENSVYKTKVLIYLAKNYGQFQDKNFIVLLNHQNHCNDPRCINNDIVNTIVQEKKNQNLEKYFTQFLVKHVECCFDLEGISKLPRSKMEIETEKYADLVFDLAEIRIVKLQQLGKTHSSVANFRRHLEKHKLMTLWSQRRFRTVLVLLQQALSERCRAPGAINIHANKYGDYQQLVTEYFQALFSTTENVQNFWQQFLNQSPRQSSLYKLMSSIHDGNYQITTLNNQITSHYPYSYELIEQITNDYFKLIQNIFPEDSLVPTIKQNQNKIKQNQMPSICDNLNSFSQISTTPLFFISLEPHSLGTILRGNYFFDKFKKEHLGEITSVNDMILPELHDFHKKTMIQSVQSDQFSFKHSPNFVLTESGKLLATKVLVQVFSSCSEGLHYIIFLKRLNYHSNMFIVRNKKEIIYTSTTFDSFTQKISQKQILNLLSDLSLNQLDHRNFDIKNVLSEKINISVRMNKQIQHDTLLALQINEDNISYQVDYTPSSLHIDKSKIRRSNNTEIMPILSREKKKIIQKSKKQNMMQRQLDLELNQIREMRELEEIKKRFQNIHQTEKGKSFVFKSHCSRIIMGVILISLIIICIFIKKGSQHIYIDQLQNNEKYYQLMQRISITAINLQLLNLNNYLNKNSTYYYECLLKAQSIYKAMDQLVGFFEIDRISEEWTTLYPEINGSLLKGSQTYFKAIPDYLENPMINLQRKNISDFNFSIFLDNIEPPLTQTQRHYNKFIINALYFAIPSLRKMKRAKFDPIRMQRLYQRTHLIPLSIIIMIFTFLFMIVFACLHWKLGKTEKFATKLIESLDQSIVSQKKQQCDSFLKKYWPPFTKHNQKKNVSSSNIEKQFEVTQNQIVLREERPQISYEVIQHQHLDEIRSSRNRERTSKKNIFTQEILILELLKRYLLLLPFFIIPISWIIMENTEKTTMEGTFRATDGTSYAKLDLTLIHLYAIQFGIYSNSLEVYQSMAKQMASLLFQMLFVINHLLAGLSQRQSDFYLKMQYGNICQLNQQGFFSSSTHFFPERFNFTYCASIDHGTLTKGFNSAIISYMQQINYLFLNNAGIGEYTIQQKLSYLNHNFFSDTTRLIDYLQVALQSSNNNIKQTYFSVIQSFSTQLIVTAIILIVILILLMTVIRSAYLRWLQTKIQQISTMYQLISYRVVISQEKYKAQFLENIDLIENLK